MNYSKNLKLSIIVPVYNVEEYIRACIESIFMQGLDEDCFEVIIVNDGTKDRSMEMIQDIIMQHHNIFVINQENQGLSVARNNGMAVAKGQYIFMPDSDDMLIENRLKPLLEKAIESQADIVVGDYYSMRNEEIASAKFDHLNFSEIEIKERTGEQMFFEFLKPRNYTVWRTLYRNDFLKHNKITFYPGIYGQDKPFTHEIYLKAHTCLMVSWPIYIYRRHPKGISYKMSEKYAKDYCKMITVMWDMATNIDLSPRVRTKMFDHTFSAFTMLSCRLVHEYKSISKSIEIIDYFNTIAPHIYFKHGFKQKFFTMMLKKCPHTYIRLRYIYSIVWEDKINPYLRHHFM